MKWVVYAVLALLAGWSWMTFSSKGREIREMDERILQLEETLDPDEEIPGLKGKMQTLESDRTLSGILLTFVSAGILGIIVVVYLLPFFAQRVTHAVYDSGETVEKDVMHDARSLVAQGDYEGAIEACRKAAEAEPLNRLPWVETAKIYKDHLDNPDAAVNTIRRALEDQEWEVNDAAYFLFRLAELYDELKDDRDSARAIMQQVIDEFPGTRHSANASHKLHEWEAGEQTRVVAKAAEEDAERLKREEEEFLAKMKQNDGSGGGQS